MKSGQGTSNSGTGKKHAKRGQPEPWTKPGHNGVAPLDHKARGGKRVR